MEVDFNAGVIKIDRVPAELDKLVMKFTGILKRVGIDYVIISGYVAILFGRSRQTEDVDIFFEKMDLEKFTRLWNELKKSGFYCMNAGTPKEGLDDYLNCELALRFAAEGTVDPNFEVKFPKTGLNQYSLDNKIRVDMPYGSLWTSKIELQIAFKLYLGSEKDIEDAIHLWRLFKEYINRDTFMGFVRKLGVTDRLKELE